MSRHLPPCMRVFAITLTTLVAWRESPRTQSFASFDDFLQQYAVAPAGKRPEVIRSFVTWQQARGGFPIADRSGNVVFVYFGPEQDVRLTGDFRPASVTSPYWDKAGERMNRVGMMFYLRKIFEADARLDYRFIADGKPTLDPLNPKTIVSGTGGGEASELVMPEHHIPEEIIARPNIPRGTLQVVAESWATPRVTIYLPPAYDTARQHPTLYTADGSAWIDYIRLPTILDNLIAAGRIEPVIAVMIDAAVDRSAWYNFNPAYLNYLRRVVTYVDSRYATRARPDARVHAGTSAGGKATAYVAFELPDLFENAAMLSPSLRGHNDYWKPFFDGSRRPDSRLSVWISAGTHEGAIHAESVRFAEYLTEAGLRVRASYVHQGHSFGAWRENSVAMLSYFFPRSP